MNENRWLASVAMLCPAQFRVLAAATCAQLSGNPADANPEFFGRPVCMKGGGEIMYYLAHSRVRQKVLMTLPSLQVHFPGAIYILTEHDDYPDNDYLTPEQWLDSIGLELYAEEEEGNDV